MPVPFSKKAAKQFQRNVEYTQLLKLARASGAKVTPYSSGRYQVGHPSLDETVILSYAKAQTILKKLARSEL